MAATGGGASRDGSPPDRIVSTVDPDSRHAHKTRERRQEGFKAHVVAVPDTGLITNTALSQASGPDNSVATVGIALLAGDPTLTDEPVEVLGDSAYGTGEDLAALAKAGHDPVIKPWPLRPAVEGGLTLDDFTINDTGDAVSCPTVSSGRSTPWTRSASAPPAATARYASVHHRPQAHARVASRPAARSPA